MLCRRVRTFVQTTSKNDIKQARPLISGQPGFRSLSLSRSMGSPNLYVLLADWDSVKAHTRGLQRRATHVAG
ncbi:hypothetical protein E3O48_16210 [Cryobacterium sp. HLT2-28]|nr:hypothetical protein E3O48_16210 [Cryobacterium sp. HLT2-28]